MIVFVSVLSIILDIIISKYVSNDSLFIPLFTIISLIIIYPYFHKPYKYFKYCANLGILYDIAYTNTLFYNFFIFILLGFIISFFYYLFSNTLNITILISIITIVSYRIINLLFFIIFKKIDFNFDIFLKSIYSSLIINIIYCILGYILTKKYSKKHNILRTN